MVDETSVAVNASQASAKVYSKQMGDRLKNLTEHDKLLMLYEFNLTDNASKLKTWSVQINECNGFRFDL